MTREPPTPPQQSSPTFGETLEKKCSNQIYYEAKSGFRSIMRQKVESDLLGVEKWNQIYYEAKSKLIDLIIKDTKDRIFRN